MASARGRTAATPRRYSRPGRFRADRPVPRRTIPGRPGRRPAPCRAQAVFGLGPPRCPAAAEDIAPARTRPRAAAAAGRLAGRAGNRRAACAFRAAHPSPAEAGPADRAPGRGVRAPGRRVGGVRPRPFRRPWYGSPPDAAAGVAAIGERYGRAVPRGGAEPAAGC